MRYIIYEVVPVNGLMLNQSKYFVTLAKCKFTVKVKLESEKHIYTLPAEHSYHYISTMVIGL